MRIIAWMLTKMLLLRFAAILFGITAFVLMLDLVANGDDVLKVNNDELWSLGLYALLRLPRSWRSSSSLAHCWRRSWYSPTLPATANWSRSGVPASPTSGLLPPFCPRRS